MVQIKFPKKNKLINEIASSGTAVGKYMYVCCPKISPLQWHAFDLSGGKDDSDNTIIMGAKGNWTKKLYSLLEERSRSDLSKSDFTILTSRAFSSPQSYIFENDVAILIAGGTGISPMIPIVNKFINDSLLENSNSKLRNIHLVWACRGNLQHVLKELLDDLRVAQLLDSVSVTIYQTGSSTKEPQRNKGSGLSAQDSSQLSIVFGRPNIYEIYTEIISNYSSNTNIGVVAVGSHKITDHAKRMVRKWGRENKRAFKINYYKASW